MTIIFFLNLKTQRQLRRILAFWTRCDNSPRVVQVRMLPPPTYLRLHRDSGARALTARRLLSKVNTPDRAVIPESGALTHTGFIYRSERIREA